MTPAARAPTPARPDALLAWMAGLADPTRLRILRVLEREELSVLELCEVLKLPQSTVSRHLKTLADQGWLSSRREGTQAFYRGAPHPEPGAQRLWRLARAETEAWSAVEQDALRLEARLEARRSEAQSFFAGAAAEWDRVRSETYGREFEVAVLRSLLPRDWTVADLGCGTGAFTAELARSGARVVGVDQSAAMLKVARRATRELPNVELHQASLESVPLPDRSCDAALLLLVLSYVAAVEPVLREAQRILAPGGRLVVVDAYPHEDESFRRRLGQARPGLDPRALLETLAALGLDAAGADGPLATRSHRSGPDLFLAQATRPGRPKP
jgi:ubiquinone/menaquinone biosynthesis C-methylase UbiE